jgi:hypothetical protein
LLDAANCSDDPNRHRQFVDLTSIADPDPSCNGASAREPASVGVRVGVTVLPHQAVTRGWVCTLVGADHQVDRPATAPAVTAPSATPQPDR